MRHTLPAKSCMTACALVFPFTVSCRLEYQNHSKRRSSSPVVKYYSVSVIWRDQSFTQLSNANALQDALVTNDSNGCLELDCAVAAFITRS